MNIKFLLFASFTMYVFFASSCKKDEDENPPRITNISPEAGSMYNTFDTIFVSALIEDDRNIEFVGVDILNQDQIPVLSPFGFRPGRATYNLNTGIIIDNIQLTSGPHFVRITAEDGRNTTREFVER